MSSVTVVPATGAANNHGYSRQAVPVKFSPPQDKSDFSPSLPFKVDYFIYNNTEYVLVKSLAKLWNYPSSYQVIAKIIRKTGVPKSDFLHKSDEDLNGSLLIEDLISSQEANSHLFYISLRFLYSVIENTSTLVGTDEVVENTAVRQRPVIPPTDDDTITVSQVFPQYGHEDNTISKDHGTFLTLTPLTKLQVYKHEGNYRRVYGTSLSAYERELIVRENNYAAFHPHAAHQIDAAEQLAAST